MPCLPLFRSFCLHNRYLFFCDFTVLHEAYQEDWICACRPWFQPDPQLLALALEGNFFGTVEHIKLFPRSLRRKHLFLSVIPWLWELISRRPAIWIMLLPFCWCFSLGKGDSDGRWLKVAKVERFVQLRKPDLVKSKDCTMPIVSCFQGLGVADNVAKLRGDWDDFTLKNCMLYHFCWFFSLKKCSYQLQKVSMKHHRGRLPRFVRPFLRKEGGIQTQVDIHQLGEMQSVVTGSSLNFYIQLIIHKSGIWATFVAAVAFQCKQCVDLWV